MSTRPDLDSMVREFSGMSVRDREYVLAIHGDRAALNFGSLVAGGERQAISAQLSQAIGSIRRGEIPSNMTASAAAELETVVRSSEEATEIGRPPTRRDEPVSVLDRVKRLLDGRG